MHNDKTQKHLTIPSAVDAALVSGPADSLLRRLEGEYSASIRLRGNELAIEGEEVDVRKLTKLFTDMFERIASGEVPDEAYLDRITLLLKTSEMAPSALREDVLLTHRGKAIRPKTAGQKRFVDAIRSHTVTFGMGPAGTGKTYLTCAMAVAALQRKEIGRIVLTRPIVEAGESLGYLPGTLMEKVDPYNRPLYDALFDM
ncbi:MAG TPA: phosphate starvation-inducible protein PhoH, partial [Eggerthellaceae bacterium]|nr:phosphate starvation-inducible protein PhoH [Eggerthellaceae bacterium]